MIKARRDRAIPGVTRAQAPHLAGIQIDPANEQIAVRIHVGGSPGRRVWKENWIRPDGTSIDRPAELPTAIVIAGCAPALVLEAMTAAVGVIDREPLLVAAGCLSEVSPGLAAIERAPHIVEECRQKTEVEEIAQLVRR